MSDTCYFDLLAPELIQLIFIYVVEPEKRNGHFIEYNVDKPPLVLLRVCKRWQFIAFQTPGIFDSLSLRRRVHAPNGFDFDLDSWVLFTFLHFPRSRHKLRPLALQLCYGDIGDYGNRLMWSDLLRMVRIIIERTENLERVYLRFPDDCMEKFLMKVCSEAGSPIKHPTLRSLTLHSTREKLLQRRYIAWWYDQAINAMPAYYHKLDTSGLPALEELGLHFPGPLTLDPICHTVRKLHVSLFKWEQLEEYLESCPKIEDLILEHREALFEQEWELGGREYRLCFPRIRRLEIRSALKWKACSDQLLRLFRGLRMPNLKTLRLRRLPQSDADMPPILGHGSLIMSYIPQLEELELIDFPPEGIGDWNIGALFSATRNLRRLSYREEEVVSCPHYFATLIRELTFFGTEARAPKLEVLELDSVHLRHGKNPIVQDLYQLIASRRHPTFYVNTSSKKRPRDPVLPCLLRKVLLPLGCSDVMRQMDVSGCCHGVEFDCVPTLEAVEKEDDLDKEGEPRDNSYPGGWQPLQWRTVREPGCSFDNRLSGSSFRSEPNEPESSTSQRTGSMVEVGRMLSQDINTQDIEGISEMWRSTSQGSFGFSRLDSVAEVELML